MARLRVTISLLCLGAAFAAGSARALQQHLVSDRCARHLRDLYHATAITDLQDARPDSAPDTMIDIYGNAIERAIADYRVDGTGQPYEAHSPDTEVTAPGAPVA